MTTENNEIFHHDTDIDVTHKINSVELNNWMSHLKYIKKELVNLIGLCTNELNGKLNDADVIERFNKKKNENEILLDALVKYANSRIDIAECEDTQCDMVYIKDEFFNKAQGKFSLLS